LQEPLGKDEERRGFESGRKHRYSCHVVYVGFIASKLIYAVVVSLVFLRVALVEKNNSMPPSTYVKNGESVRTRI